MKDIAAELGVSINTVHKALTGKAGVSESVRAKVNAKADTSSKSFLLARIHDVTSGNLYPLSRHL